MRIYCDDAMIYLRNYRRRAILQIIDKTCNSFSISPKKIAEKIGSWYFLKNSQPVFLSLDTYIFSTVPCHHAGSGLLPDRTFRASDSVLALYLIY